MWIQTWSKFGTYGNSAFIWFQINVDLTSHGFASYIFILYMKLEFSWINTLHVFILNVNWDFMWNQTLYIQTISESRLYMNLHLTWIQMQCEFGLHMNSDIM